MINNLVICFLGPDGSGKSTIINGLVKQKIPFLNYFYFHLKPFIKPKVELDEIVDNPHEKESYSQFKSYIKLLFFIYQYNWGWLKNVRPLKKKSTLIIFDRYYDDMLVDSKRYRYGGSRKIAKSCRKFIPKPDLYFILSAEPDIIFKRKQEVSFEELKSQIINYNDLCDHKKYIYIDVNRSPEDIIKEIILVLNLKIKKGNNFTY